MWETINRIYRLQTIGKSTQRNTISAWHIICTIIFQRKIDYAVKYNENNICIMKIKKNISL